MRPTGRPFARLERFDSAACAGHPQPDLWFSGSPASRAVARAICAGCPVRDACLAGAVRRGEKYGTWGRAGPGPARRGARRVGRPAAIGRVMTRPPSHTQLELPLVLPADPTRPASWVAALLGVPIEVVHVAIDAGELPGTHVGEQWQVPLWAIPAFSRSVA